MEITNTSMINKHFPTGTKNGEPVYETIAPGETKDIKVAEDNPEYVAAIAMGCIRVKGGSAGQKKTAPSDKPAA